MTDGLFAPVDDRNQQWRLESLLLCNWGGFGGITVIDLHPDSSLLSGASGAGKSTVLDAYTALINPGRPFNIASNDATERRRSEGARTTLTYVRGQYDRTERDGELVPRVLRGDGQDTWSAIAAVFVSTTGARCTPLRLFFAPQEAVNQSDLSPVHAVFDGRLERRHLELIEPLAQKAFRKDALERTLPGLRVLPAGQYAETVQAKLHIGRPGDGAKALKLLHELQAGKPQPSVNALFKQLVLEQPVTFDEADAVIASFDTLDEGYREIRSKEDQLAVLAAIETDHFAFTAAQAEIDRIDTLGVSDPGPSPFLLWARRRKAALYADEIELAQESHQAAEDEQAALAERIADLREDLDQIELQYLAGGGNAIEAAELALARLRVRRSSVRDSRTAYERRTADVVPAPDTAEDFAAAQRKARTFLDGHDAEAGRLDAAKKELFPDYYRLRNAVLPELEGELRHLKQHAGNIDSRLHALRVRFAEAAGLTPADLPFAGELIDVHPEHEDWRVAADAVLGGLAVTLLVAEEHRRTLRTAIDGLRTDSRIRYRGVSSLPLTEPGGTTLAGRLVVQDGPFAGWLRDHLDRQFAYECVETAADLGDDSTPRVTRTGQTQQGRQGAHGGNRVRRIGFSNEQRQAELQAELDRARQEAAALDERIRRFEEQERDLVRQREA